MPAAPLNTIFGAANCKLDNKMLGHLAQMCNSDRPVSLTTMLGDFAFSEICVSEDEAAYFKDILVSLRSQDHAKLVADIVSRLGQKAASTKNAKLGQLAAATQDEYARLAKVFFLRSRCIEVSRVSTQEVIGRIVSFPDQVSDDYGNNVEPRGEKGMNPTKVASGERAKGYKGRTLYLGYGQGATMAQICACLQDEQCIVFDSTLLSDILSCNFFREEMPKGVEMGKRADVERDWNVLYESVEFVAKRYAAALPKAVELAKEVVKEHEARKAEEKKVNGNAQQQQPARMPAVKKDGEGGKDAEERPNPVEQAEDYFAKRKSYKISGLVPEAIATRFEQNGKFPSSALSNLLGDYMTIVAEGSYPYAVYAKGA